MTLNKAYYASSNTKGVGNYSSDSAIAKSDANMKKESFATSLGDAFVYVEGNYPKLAWEVNGGEEPTETTTEETTIATTEVTTTTTKTTTTITTTTTEDCNPEFVIGNISAKAGAGYGEVGSDTEWPVTLPIIVNNDPGMRSIKLKLLTSEDLNKVFQLDHISYENEEKGIRGPYSGPFTYSEKYWTFVIYNDYNDTWEKQPDGTPFMYYYIKVTEDESVIASTASKMGIKLEKDENGSYYKFPMKWDTDYDYAVSDVNFCDFKTTLTDGSIKVYVSGKKQTTAATTKATTNKATVATTAAVTKKATTITTTTAKAETKTTTEDCNPEFVIGNISAKAGAGYGEEGSDTEYSVVLPITVNNDPEMNVIQAKLYTSQDLAKIFQLEEISLCNEDGKPGPYVGVFQYGTSDWNFVIAQDSKNWKKQTDGTAFVYYYIKVTEDESVIASTASKMGIKLEKDENGSYYKFPMKWDTDYNYEVTKKNDNAAPTYYKPTLTDGSIKVYVSGKKQTTTATTKATANKTTIATTAAVTKKTTTITTITTKAETKTTTEDCNPEFVIGNISAKAGAGYGAEGSDTEWSVVLPITVNNDPGLAGLKGQLQKTYDLSKVFQLEKVSLSDENDVPGPYTGTFTYEEKYWAYGIAKSRKEGNWDIQPNETPFAFYYFKITEDESVIASTASKMGIKLEKDENGSYYKFPIKWDKSCEAVTWYEHAGIDIPAIYTDGSIKVYVGNKAETTAATTKATTSVTTTQAPLEVSPKSTTIEVGDTFTIEAKAADNPIVHYSVNKSGILVVDANGKAAGISSGSVNVIVYTDDGRNETVKVTVIPVVETTKATTKATTTTAMTTTTPKATTTTAVTTTIPKVTTTTAMTTTTPKATTTTAVTTTTPKATTTTAMTTTTAIVTTTYKATTMITTTTTTTTQATTTTTYEPMYVTPDEINILQYNKAKITVTGGDGDYSFLSSDESVAEVETDGTITGVKPGRTTITVMDGVGHSEIVYVIVTGLTTPATKVTTTSTSTTTTTTTTTTTITTVATTIPYLHVSPRYVTINVGEDYYIDVTGGSGYYSFSSSDESVAVVGSRGTILGISSGQATVTVKDDYGNSSVVYVTVKAIATTAITTTTTTARTYAVTTRATTLATTTRVTYADLVVSPKYITLSSYYDSAKITVTGGDGNYSFSSDNSNVEVTLDGTVTSYSYSSWYSREATITVTDGSGQKAYVYVTIAAVTAVSTACTTSQAMTTATTTTTTTTTARTYAVTTRATSAALPEFYVTPRYMTLEPGESESIYVSSFSSCYFSSDDESIATVDVDGTVTAVSSGKTYITVRNSYGQSDTVYVTVQAETTVSTTSTTSEETTYPYVTETTRYTEVTYAATTARYTETNSATSTVLPEFYVTPHYMTLKPGESKYIYVSGFGSCEFKSENESIATVDDDGTVTAVNSGKTYITVRNSYGQSDTVYVTVQAATTVSTTSATKTEPTLKAEIKTDKIKVGEKIKVEVNSNNVKFESSNEDVAIVSKTGVITPISAGTAVITVTNTNGDKKEIKITVDNIPTPTTPKDNGTISKPETKTQLGDVNDDGAIDSKDAVLVLKYYAESLTGSTTTSISTEKGDVNGDGKIDSKDAVKILKYYAQTMVGLKVNIKDV